MLSLAFIGCYRGNPDSSQQTSSVTHTKEVIHRYHTEDNNGAFLFYYIILASNNQCYYTTSSTPITSYTGTTWVLGTKPVAIANIDEEGEDQVDVNSLPTELSTSLETEPSPDAVQIDEVTEDGTTTSAASPSEDESTSNTSSDSDDGSSGDGGSGD